MSYSLTTAQIQQIVEILPPELAQLRDRYPNTTYELACAWHLPPFPVGYTPQLIELYYSNDDGTDSPDFVIEAGSLTSIRIPTDETRCEIIQLEIDGQWAFIQIGSAVVLDRISGRVVLPEVLLDISQLAQSFIHAIV
ncbi:hypothetical protein ACQ4M3_05500 [Leptolyngbya sp. AN03gr2]|uniref:hypothetical protein n=1 Tax=unclassified Leptolyngbya TaxID=2650499 RepID=UPI003D31BED6